MAEQRPEAQQPGPAADPVDTDRLPPRWRGSAAVPPPGGNRGGRRPDPTLELPQDEGDGPPPPAVDPWPDATPPWDPIPLFPLEPPPPLPSGPLPTDPPSLPGGPPHVGPPHTDPPGQPHTGPPGPPHGGPQHVGPPPSHGGTPTPPAPGPAAVTPPQALPVPRSPEAPPASPAHPAGPTSPAYPVTPAKPAKRPKRVRRPRPDPAQWTAPPRRRRRRWPKSLTMLLLTFGCCCACPAYYVAPIWQQYPAAVSTPAEAAGLRKHNDAGSARTVQRLENDVRRQNVLAEDVFAAVYAGYPGQRVTVFGSVGFRLAPKSDLETEINRLTPRYKLTALREVDAGSLGGYQTCGVGATDGADRDLVLCGWADHGSLGVATFTADSLDRNAELLREIRADLVRRDRG